MIARPSQAHSVAERYLQRVFDVLTAAGTEASWFICRGRVDAHGIDELPALNIRRSTGMNSSFGHGVDQGTLEFEIDHLVRGEAWETEADRLHMEVNAALCGDAVLHHLGKGLRCIRTDPRAQSAEEVRGTLTATYQFQSLHRASDMTVKL